VTFERCLFVGMQNARDLSGVATVGNAITLTGGARVLLHDCAFAPHTAVAAFQGSRDARAERGQVELNHCSLLLGSLPTDTSAGFRESSAFRFENAQDCEVKVTNCLVSDPSGDRDAVLIRQVDDSTFTYRGLDNRYQGLTSFLTRPGIEESADTWEKFQTEMKKGDNRDDASRILPASPWVSEDPLTRMESLDRTKLREAFQVNPEDPDLRQKSSSRHLIGVEGGPWGGLAYNAQLPALPDKRGTASQKIVNPDVNQTGGGVYKTLAAAIEEARPGDEILIQKNGKIAFPPVRLEKSDIDLTIKPAPNFKPIITLGPTSEPDAFLFRLHDGRLKLEKLQVQLEVGQDEFASMSVVMLAGDGSCTLSGCLITLVETTKVTTFSAVTLADPGKLMKMGTKSGARPASGHASLTIDNCVIRGEGTLLTVPASRSFELEVANSLTALSGSAIAIDVGSEEAAMPAPGAAVQIKLDSDTFYLTNHLVRLRAGKDIKSLVPMQVRCDASLFVAATGKSLIHLDGPETNLDKMKGLVSWTGSRNAYTNFTNLVDQQPPDNVMSEAPIGPKMWTTSFAVEANPVFNKVKLLAMPESPLSRVAPGQFKLQTDTEMSGSHGPQELEKLPKPSENGK
jgi:hypothetical protein